MENEVVKDVKAESALEYAAAINPNKKSMPITVLPESMATVEKSKSFRSAEIPFSLAYMYSIAPSVRNKRFTTTPIISPTSSHYWTTLKHAQ